MKSKDEILKAETAREVLEWLKENPAPHDKDVADYFNELARKEFEARIPDYDPGTHYDFF